MDTHHQSSSKSARLDSEDSRDRDTRWRTPSPSYSCLKTGGNSHWGFSQALVHILERRFGNILDPLVVCNNVGEEVGLYNSAEGSLGHLGSYNCIVRGQFCSIFKFTISLSSSSMDFNKNPLLFQVC